MDKDVLLLTGAGQIGMAIARRMGMDKKIVIGDKNINNAKAIAATMKNAGFAEAVKWGERGARINSISPGIIVTPLAIDEFNGPRGDFYKNMFAKCPAGRPGTADEVAHVAELLMSPNGAFITGADFLIDGGATASFFYGPLKPNK